MAAKPTKTGRAFVSRHIRLHLHEGMPKEQAMAAALSEARRSGKMPPRPAPTRRKNA